ncbi:MAG: hypothetical protein KDA64_05195 [Rhodospirillaceae bacterium]|nr:hypothetical protein [Rhodospirillaceae bacterium]
MSMLLDTGSGGVYSSIGVPSFSALRFVRYRPSRRDFVGEFDALLRNWRYKARSMSSSDQIINLPEFARIVEMGKKVVPLIINELRSRPDHLVAAMVLITGESPITDRERGDMYKMADAWIDWYERNR